MKSKNGLILDKYALLSYNSIIFWKSCQGRKKALKVKKPLYYLKLYKMLDFSDSHIKEIAIQLNFEDQFYFSRVFKKLMGLSPAEYRKKKKG